MSNLRSSLRPALLAGVCALGLFSFIARAQDTLPAFVEAGPLPVNVPNNSDKIRYVGRFDTRDKNGPRCAWPASTVEFRFKGTDANVRLLENSNDRWQIEVDGTAAETLQLKAGDHEYRVANGLADGAHTVRLVKATESFVGTTQILGFELNAGAELLPPVVPTRKLLVVGDSISAGYGNEAAAKEERYSPKTQNAYKTYGAITARALGADYMCIAWSGKKMWPNNTLPELFDLALPRDPESKWDTTKWVPDVIVINLATNDFSKAAPEQEGWTTAYKAFIARLRAIAPNAQIYCAIGPMMSDWQPFKALTTVRGYMNTMIPELQKTDPKVQYIEFPTQKFENGIGADWHPSLTTHQLMGDQLTAKIKADLGWE